MGRTSPDSSRYPPRDSACVAYAAALVFVFLPYRFLHGDGACLQRSTVRGVYILHIDVHRCGYCRPLGRILVCEHYNAVVNSQFGVKHAAGLAGEAPKLFGTEYLLEELDGAGSAVDDEVGR